ncbi:copper chaperone for superoxide dismutase-like [Glandiceps talaboti]
MATATKMDVAVQMTCQSCVEDIKKRLDSIKDIKVLNISLANEQVVIETTLSTSQVVDILESTGRKAVILGQGSSTTGQSHLGAAVSMLEVGPVKGVIRFLQSDRNKCIIEGTLDGLSPGSHPLNIHELGDISQGCESCGDVFNPYEVPHGPPAGQRKVVGNLGNVLADDSGRAVFRKEDKLVKVWDIIGRSTIIHQPVDGSESGPGLACGIIARAAGLFQNTKKFCSCDGITIWEERDVPLAGLGRQQPHASL